MGYRSYRVREPFASGVCSPSYCYVKLEDTLPCHPQRKPHQCSSAWSERVKGISLHARCTSSCFVAYYHEILKVIVVTIYHTSMGRLAQVAETHSEWQRIYSKCAIRCSNRMTEPCWLGWILWSPCALRSASGMLWLDWSLNTYTLMIRTLAQVCIFHWGMLSLMF